MSLNDDGRSHLTGRQPSYDPLYVAIMELKARLDTLIQVTQIREETQALELKHIRESLSQQHTDHETRLRELERRRYVEPRAIWTALGILTAVGSLLVAIINVATR